MHKPKQIYRLHGKKRDCITQTARDSVPLDHTSVHVVCTHGKRNLICIIQVSAQHGCRKTARELVVSFDDASVIVVGKVPVACAACWSHFIIQVSTWCVHMAKETSSKSYERPCRVENKRRKEIIAVSLDDASVHVVRKVPVDAHSASVHFLEKWVGRILEALLKSQAGYI